ncbi:zinc finger protein RFP-like [Sceloporus undulatus]|uniref:zinc finger protein RFP-like n=1 Tax=Sceloporus undulatus TaxID=8520 RepID=UPI001C4BE8E7|nr:zinc finger protein RFP-like [Sceloporus undulatus]
MAAASARDPLEEETTCSICLDYFKDPVTIECGHNFCQACLTQWWRESGTAETCPQCREKILQRNLRPNRQLANLIEIMKKARLQGAKGAEGKERACGKHQEPLKLFCKDHETSICVVCDKSKEHENHKVIPLEEASESYKDRIWNLLETLKKEREKILAFKAKTEQESQVLIKATEKEKRKTVVAFRQMHEFLEEQEKVLLSQMEETEKEISAKREEHLAILSEELSFLEDLIWEVEEKNQQPASELLQNCLLDAMDGCLYFVLLFFPDVLLSGPKKVNVTLDPDTAFPRLILSEDFKSVRWNKKYQALPNHPDRFNLCPFVLGRQEFSAGRYYWDVSVGCQEHWAVGVARKSVRRKGPVTVSPKCGIWAVGNSDFPPCLDGMLQKIRVFLSCAEGQVAFYDVDTQNHLYTFSGASFAGEIILPFFRVFQGGYLRISS